MKVPVYMVWSKEDSDIVNLFQNKDEAEALYESYGEFGMWEEKELDMPDELPEGDGPAKAHKKDPSELGDHVTLGSIRFYIEGLHLGVAFNAKAMKIFDTKQQATILRHLSEMFAELSETHANGEDVFAGLDVKE